MEPTNQDFSQNQSSYKAISNSLASTHPELAQQWHPIKNGILRPEYLLAGSGKKVWWKCSKDPDHEWQATLCNRSRKKSGCPYCRNLLASPTNSLAAKRPDLASEWHPSKNGSLNADSIVVGSGKKVWWQCNLDITHEWQTTIRIRTSGSRCPYCANLRASTTNSLAIKHPDLAAQWHPTKNGNLLPDHVTSGSTKKIWWSCVVGLDHEWQASVDSRISRESGCPACANLQVSITNSLEFKYPNLVSEWHPTKNGTLVPKNIVAGSSKKVWWKCNQGPDHEWYGTVVNRTRLGRGCPMCSGVGVSITNSLVAKYPEVAAQWHPTKNGNLSPETFRFASGVKVWWKCNQEPSHEWQAVISKRTLSNRGCPACVNQKISLTNSLATKFPELAAEWHQEKNENITPNDVVAGSDRKVWWKCSQESTHEWQATISNRSSGGRKCPYCSNRRVSGTNSLAIKNPELVNEWHPIKNDSLSPDEVVAGTHKIVWWKCPQEHEWQASIASRTSNGSGCPYCNRGWTIQAIRLFVASLKDHLQTFTPAELYILFQQNGLLQAQGKGKAFAKALTTGQFPQEEIEKFVKGDPSLVDEFVSVPNQTLENLKTEHNQAEENLDSADSFIDDLPQKTEELQLPVVETKEILKSLELNVFSSADEEAVKFLLASAVAKLWKHAYSAEDSAFDQAQSFASSAEYSKQVQTKFLEEYNHSKQLPIPEGYSFPWMPNLMQRHLAVQVRDQKRVGNWSGTGAGKTLSAILATRVVDSKFTVICCPNSVVEGWRSAISSAFKDSQVVSKTFGPYHWEFDQPSQHKYIVLNYEAFQQPESVERVKSFVEREIIDCIIVDEIHYAKQRTIENISLRRQLVTALVTLASERNPNLHVLGMSATPVINNLQEGKSMVELVTGLAHDELDTRPTVANCMRLHQRLLTLGIRWMPDYKKMLGYECREEKVEIDCEDFIDEIRALGKSSSPIKLEQILTRARLPIIREQVRPKTLIYTYYIDGIDKLLHDALVEDGWKVGFYTGEDKTGKEAFISGDVDILIATSAIGTGVDGLQKICNRLIINVLPWTRAEYEQLLGRIYRQGQVNKEEVSIIIPLTYAMVNGERWSWCESKMQRLMFKKSLADSAVDGVVPEGHLRSSAQAHQDIMAWLERLNNGEVEVITRAKIVVPLPDTDSTKVKKRLAKYGDFSVMNRNWNQSKSDVTNKRLAENSEEWAQYHTLYREARKDWAVVPYEEMIRWCEKRPGKVIGDFGCGEAKFAAAISDKNTVYSFDHVAINENVIACDMTRVPLEDEVLDIAIFSLSLMGSNFTDYLREAYRMLKLDGDLHIVEATSRFTNRDDFVEGLKKLGFAVVSVEDKWKFTHIWALKTEISLSYFELYF